MRFPSVSSGVLMMPAGVAAGGGAPGAGADQNPGAAFDADAFMSKLLGEFDKRVNALDKRFKGLEEKIVTRPAADPSNPDPAAATSVDPATGGDPPTPKKNAELTIDLQRLQRQLEALQKEADSSKKLAADNEAKAVEADRQRSFMAAIQDMPFPTNKDGAPTKARQQFVDAYLPKVQRNAESGEFFVDTDSGPVGVQKYLQSEFEASPHFQAPQGHGGAGASGGTRIGGASKMPDFANMSTAQISQIPKAERDAHMADLVRSLSPTGG